MLIDNWTYTHTIRCPVIHRESPELKMQVTARKYEVIIIIIIIIIIVFNQ